MARAKTRELQRRLAFLARASAELNESFELDATVKTAARVAVPEFADWCVLEVLETGAKHTAGLPSFSAGQLRALQELWDQWRTSGAPNPLSARTLSSAAPRLVSKLSAEDLGMGDSALTPQDVELVAGLGPLSVIAVPLVARNQVLGAMTFLATGRQRPFDETDLVLAEALVGRCAVAIENARLYADAQDAWRARDTFLSIASHELGSPLARVKAYVEVLMLAHSRKELDEDLLSRSLVSMDRAVGRLVTVTRDLLDVSRLRVGDLLVRQVPLNLAPLVHEVLKHYGEELGVRHRLTISVPPGTYPVNIDPDRFEQVLDNLVGNALKYSPDGGIVALTLERDGGGVLLQVRDQGIGLPPGAADAIFEPFGRAANAHRRNLPGMGLGLYICRSLVERHAGRIWAESAGEGQGTTLSIWLPLARPVRPE